MLSSTALTRTPTRPDNDNPSRGVWTTAHLDSHVDASSCDRSVRGCFGNRKLLTLYIPNAQAPPKPLVSKRSMVFLSVYLPKGPCRYLVYAWAFKGFSYYDFGTYVLPRSFESETAAMGPCNTPVHCSVPSCACSRSLSLSVYIYMHIYIYISELCMTYVCTYSTCKYVHMFTNMEINEHVCRWIYMYIYIYISGRLVRHSVFLQA